MDVISDGGAVPGASAGCYWVSKDSTPALSALEDSLKVPVTSLQSALQCSALTEFLSRMLINMAFSDFQKTFKMLEDAPDIQGDS